MSLRKALLLSAAAFMALSAVSLRAQTDTQSVVTIDSCRAMALANNKQLRMKSQAVRMTEYQRKEAFAAYLPALDFNGGYMYNQKNLSIFDSDQLLPIKKFDPKTGSYQFEVVTNPETGQPVLGPGNQPIPSQMAYLPKDAMTYDIHNVFFGAITLTQPVFMGGKIVAMNRLTMPRSLPARFITPKPRT